MIDYIRKNYVRKQQNNTLKLFTIIKSYKKKVYKKLAIMFPFFNRI